MATSRLPLSPKQAWYQAHRDTELPKAKNRARLQRERYRAEHRLSPEELARCQADPTLAWTIRGPKWVACLEAGCGALCESLGPHLRRYHCLTAPEYKRARGFDGVTPRLNKGASLLSHALRDRLSKRRRKLRLGTKLQRSGKVPPVEKLIASRGKRTLSVQYRLEQAERMRRGRPELWGRFRGKRVGAPAEDWRLAKMALDGMSNSEIAKRVGLRHGQTVGARLRKMGFENSRKARVYHHGLVLRVNDLRKIAHDLGKTLGQMADDMGLKYKTLKGNAASGRSNQALSVFIGSAFKKRMPKWRAEFRRRPAGDSGGRPLLLLQSERNRVRDDYDVLLADLKAVLNRLADQFEHDTPMSFSDLRTWIYLEARKGRLRRIAFWPELLERLADIAATDQRVLRGGVKPSDLAREILAVLYGVSAETIRRAALATS